MPYHTARIDRELAARIAHDLGDALGNREALILADPLVCVRRHADYPGCWVCVGNNARMTYRQADNAIVG